LSSSDASVDKEDSISKQVVNLAHDLHKNEQ